MVLSTPLFGSLAQHRAVDSRTRIAMSTRFSRRTTLSSRKPAPFVWENCYTVVILVQGAIGISKESMLVTKRKINRPGYKFYKHFR